MPEGLLWRGKPIESLTREELIEALMDMAALQREYEKSLNGWAEFTNGMIERRR